MSIQSVLDDLKDTYVALHERKEDLFWEARMGLSEGAGKALAQAEIEVRRFLQDPDRLRRLRELEASGEGSEGQRRVLGGWIAMLRANVVESPEGRKLSEEIVEAEEELARKRASHRTGFVDPATGALEEASTNRLALMMRTDPDEGRRRAAFEGLRALEGWVLENGFLEIVRRRNRLGRILGYEDFYDWRTSVVERMPKREVFDLLEDLERRTRGRALGELAAFEKEKGAGAREPWNFLYLRTGDLTRDMDPYFAFGTAMRRWGESFARLGVKYRGATLTLDLMDRVGKYENGFMHAPGIGFRDAGRWKPARINFTSNAMPSQVGSGLRALETLFHEGGHAAHFANILQDAPCFAHEYAPTSVAYAETQSMFMDSIVGDADWRRTYARDASGQAMPMDLMEREIAQVQPFLGWSMRAMLTIPMAERALYEMSDPTPERVLERFREIERETQGLTSGQRPVLAVPHLLAGESSAYYHGYILAEMAVHQTRAFFLGRDGYLCDNPRVGPDLAQHYWSWGNSVGFADTLRALTGRGLSADALVERCNMSVDAAVAEARASVARVAAPAEGPVDLEARVRVVHGHERIADTAEGGFEAACRAFEAWVGALAPA